MGVGDIVEVGQKIQTSSYKISYGDINCRIVTSVKNSIEGGRGDRDGEYM